PEARPPATPTGVLKPSPPGAAAIEDRMMTALANTLRMARCSAGILCARRPGHNRGLLRKTKTQLPEEIFVGSEIDEILAVDIDDSFGIAHHSFESLRVANVADDGDRVAAVERAIDRADVGRISIDVRLPSGNDGF